MYEYNYNDQNNFQSQQTWMNQDPGSMAQGGRNDRHGMGHRDGKGSRFARFARRAGAITLSAVLFGGVASGTFLAINHLAGYSASDSADAQSGQMQERTRLLTADAAVPNTAQTAAGNGSMDVSAIAQSVMPSIVSITNKSVQEVRSYFSMFGYGGQTVPQEMESVGSGIIIGQNDEELLIVTNYHVIADAASLSASFIDNSVYEAAVKGTDPSNDLAVIAIPLADISSDTMDSITIAKVGDSDSLKVGEQVVAIGNALGYGQSVTTGIVSATNRTLSGPVSADTQNGGTKSVPSYIQTDAAINPGNSGGALVNMRGEVIGINSAKLASTEVEGMGYAIPVSRVSDIIETLMNKTTRTKAAESERGALGISAVQVNEAVTAAYGIPGGVYVADVTKGGAAEAAGLRKGDVITAFDGENITDMSQLTDILTYYKAGETVELTVQSINDGVYGEKKVTITLQAAASQEENGQEEA